MTPKAIFWDNDGVLVDTERLYFEANQRVLSRIDIALTETDYIDLFMVQASGAWHLAAARGLTASEIDQLRQERNALYSQLVRDTTCLIAGVPQVLQELHGRYVMGVVTSSRRDHFDIIHADTNLRRYFDFLVTADDCAHVKPDPEPYRRALALSGCEPHECLAVEDSERGLEAATGAGIPCVIIPTHLTARGQFRGAIRVLENVAGLLAMLSESRTQPRQT